MKLFVSLLVYVYLIQAYPAQLYRSPLFGGSDMGPNFDDRAYSMAPKVIGFTRLLIRSSANGVKRLGCLLYELKENWWEILLNNT